MNEESIKETIGCLLNALVENRDAETTREFGSAIDKLMDSPYDLKNMEHFDILLMFKLDNALRMLVYRLNPEVADRNKIDELFFIYSHYSYLDRSLSNMIAEQEGSACSVDKSRWLINGYREYILTGNVPDMEIDVKCYWKPHFGTGQQWMNLCVGLEYFYHGQPSKYFQAIKEIHQIQGVTQ